MSKKIIWFKAPWCQPCKILKPEIDEAIEKTGAELEVVDVDTNEGADIANQNGVKSVPTIIIRGESTSERLTGFTEADEIINSVKNLH